MSELNEDVRELNEEEKKFLKSDLYPLKVFLEENGLFDSSIKETFDNTFFKVGNSKNLKGASGRHDNDAIVILDSLLPNNYERAKTIYHELVHQLFGKDTVSDNTLEQIINLVENNPTELKLEPVVYLQGLKCLEEYLAEIFSITACTYAKGINPPIKQRLSTPGISKDYAYYTNFGTNYGIFQTSCEKIITNLFGSNDNAIRAAFNREYFSSFFETNNNIEMMKLLGNLGQIYGAIQTYAGYERNGVSEYSPDNIKRLLIETDLKVDNIKRHIPNQSAGRSHL